MVGRRENDGCLPASVRRRSLQRPPIQEKESREILPVVLYAALENDSAINFRRSGGGDRRGVGGAFVGQRLHAAGGIVVRNFLNIRMLFEEADTLVQRDRMR